MLTKLSSISNGIIGKNRILTDIAKDVEEILDSQNKDFIKLLEIASDKNPVFLSFLAREYPKSYFVHFKDDDVRSPKVHPDYEAIDNLDIIYSKQALKKRINNNKYDIISGFFTLHELNNPQKSLRKTKPYLKDDGKLIIVDYNLKWFNSLISEQNKNKGTAKKEFSKYVFNASNERKVLGMRNGKDWNNPNVEVDCMKNHTIWAPEKYVRDCKKTGYKQILLKSYFIETPWGKKPKMFLYIGEKQK